MNIVPETRLGGRMASNGYLKGKVVLLDVRDYSKTQDASAMTQIQDIWAAFKSKQFVAIGSNNNSDSSEAARALIKRLNLTYSVYDGVRLKNDDAEAELAEGVYVFDSVGRKVYYGNEPRMAMGVVGNAIFSTRIPSTLKSWKDILDYETSNLPGQAYLRIRDLKSRKDILRDFVAKYPEDAKKLSEIWKGYSNNSEVKRLAKLVEMSRLVKDADKSSKQARRITRAQIDRLISQYSILTKSEDALISQEAKNALADLKFSRATLK